MLPKLKKTTSFKFDKPCHNAQERGPPRSEKEKAFLISANGMSSLMFHVSGVTSGVDMS